MEYHIYLIYQHYLLNFVFVLENTNGDIVGVEVKSSTKINKKYLSGLLELQDLMKEKFKRGFVIYAGQDIVPLAEKIWAVPVCYFWK